jgi:hypothetical protein
MRRFPRLLICAGLSLALAAISAATSVSSIQIADAWIRWLPGNLPAGGYLTVINNGDSAVKLIGASSDDYDSVSLHQSRLQGEAAGMVSVASISIAAHSSLDFAVRGYHLMLLQPKRALKPGDRAVITLKFASAAPMTVQFRVLPPDATGPGT